MTVNCGDDQTFTITPASCYQIADVLVDGVSVGAVASYTFTDVAANHTIAATLRADDLHHHRVGRRRTASITPSGAVTVNCGADQTFTITPASRLPDRRRAGGRRLGGRGDELHLHRRVGEPHHRGELRGDHLHHHGHGRCRRRDQPERRGRPSTAAPTRRSPSRRRAATRSPTCWWTASRWARWRATPSPTWPRTTPSRPASLQTTYTITASAGAGGIDQPRAAR